MYKTREVAAKLGFTFQGLTKWVADGIAKPIPGTGGPKGFLFSAEEVGRLVALQRADAKEPHEVDKREAMEILGVKAFKFNELLAANTLKAKRKQYSRQALLFDRSEVETLKSQLARPCKLRTSEAAKILGVDPSTVYNWGAKGDISTVERSIYGERRYDRSEVEMMGRMRASMEGTRKINDIPQGFDIITTYPELTQYTEAFAKGGFHFLLLVGSPGSGKTRQMGADLAQTEVRHIAGHLTPGGFYAATYNAAGKPIVIDDIPFIKDDQSCSIMKALTQTEDEREVSWESMRGLPEGVPNTFKTTSQVCLIANKWNNRNEDYAAIQDRATAAVAFYPSAETIHERVIALGWCDQEVLDFVAQHWDKIQAPSMRDYHKAMAYKKSRFDWRRKMFSLWA